MPVPSRIGCETWSREGVYFFPDACFYEFIPEDEMNKNVEDPSYQPRTILWDEVVPGDIYEIVLTVFKGGAFARYRVGDVFRCTGIGSQLENNSIPRFQLTGYPKLSTSPGLPVLRKSPSTRPLSCPGCPSRLGRPRRN